jgi:hypothetical protein
MPAVEERWRPHRAPIAAESARNRQSSTAWPRSSIVGLFTLLLWAGVAVAQNPAVLVVSPQSGVAGWADLDYLGELRSAGFEVDYTDKTADFTWDRIRAYNVLIIYAVPPPPGVDAWPFNGTQPIYQSDFIALVERFLQEGGGVLLLATETQIRFTLTRELITRWGADLPLERIVDPQNTVMMSRMPTVPLTYTDAVAASPVSAGVRGIWYPTLPHYNTAHSAPLQVDGNWQVVVRGMPTARTEPVDLSASAYPGPPNPLIRPGGVSAPPLFAIRQLGPGRIALAAQLPTYSTGSGTKWLYNREVLSTGLKGTPSDFGLLLQNSFRWLAAPSLQSQAVGGYVTPANRLIPPNRRPEAMTNYQEISPGPDDPALLQPPTNSVLFKGLIGAQTSASGGSGTVAQYAAAAKQAGLDFLVFLEDFARLDAAELDQLKAECRQYSDDTLTLYPGYRIDNNIGNHMFLFGDGAIMPPAQVLTGPDQKTFMLQGETSPGVFGITPTYPIDFFLSLTGSAQIGYYDFSHSGMGLRVPDARLYGMAALHTYRNGVLVDDARAGYLTAAQSTSLAAPVAVHLVSSPAALSAAVSAAQGLTYGQARARASLWADALRYSSQYDCLNVFPSSGPLIHRWPWCGRITTLGAEPFVTGRSRMDAPVHVTADQGLREIRIYDGERLFRRFALSGEQVFSTVLHLEASVQRNLVLVAEDRAGGQAVSAARRSWKDGSLMPVFCSDRVNDCGNMFLARGPYPTAVLRTPAVADAGVTWDGGPRGILTPIIFEGSNPALESDQGAINGDQYNQTPLLQFGDEGAVRVRSVRDELIDERVPSLNPWRTYGPRAPAGLMDFSLDYVQWDRASVNVPASGWAGPPEQAGCNAAIFRGTVSFKQPLKVSSLRVLRNWHWIPSVPVHLVVGRGAAILTEIDVAAVEATQSLRLEAGDWFGFYSAAAANSQVFVNRGDPLDMRIMKPPDSSWLTLWAVVDGTDVSAGDSYTYELFSAGCPLDAAAHDAETLRDQVAYLAKPERLQITRGRRVTPSALLEARVDRYAVHVVVPRPSAVKDLTIPMMVHGLNRRWSAGLWQLRGFVKGAYGGGEDRYRAIGIDDDGRAYVPLYASLADWTEVEVGHPVSADASGANLFIQVTALSGGTAVAPGYEWAVEVNNPTDAPVTTTLRQRMALPNLSFGTQAITLAAGEHRVVYRSSAAPPPATPTPTTVVANSPTPTTSPSRTGTATGTPTPTATRTRTRTLTAAPTKTRTLEWAVSYPWTYQSPTPTPTATPAPVSARRPQPTDRSVVRCRLGSCRRSRF